LFLLLVAGRLVAFHLRCVPRIRQIWRLAHENGGCNGIDDDNQPCHSFFCCFGRPRLPSSAPPPPASQCMHRLRQWHKREFCDRNLIGWSVITCHKGLGVPDEPILHLILKISCILEPEQPENAAKSKRKNTSSFLDGKMCSNALCTRGRVRKGDVVE